MWRFQKLKSKTKAKPSMHLLVLRARKSWTPKKTFTVVNFHLDAMSNNEHRTTQFQNLADDVDEDEPFVLCGDTNLFTFFPRSKQQLLLDKMIEPLSSKMVLCSYRRL